MTVESRAVYAVPTHLQEREPFAFGRTVGEIAKLVTIGFVAARLVSSNELPGPVRMPAAATLLLIGLAWALVRVQRRPLDSWLELAFRYGVRPKRQVWRSRGPSVPTADIGSARERGNGLYELEHVRVRWAEEVSVASGRTRDFNAQTPTQAGAPS